MHGLPEWTKVSIFYNSINTPTRMMLDASTNGTLLDRPPREGLTILEKLTQNDYQHPTTRRGTMRRGTAQLDSFDTILAQTSTLTNMVKNLPKHPAIHEVKNQEAALKSLENQVGQISQVLKSRPMGGFPSDTEVAKGFTHEQCKAISTRRGKVLKTQIENKQREAAVAKSKVAGDTDNPTPANTPAPAREDHNIPTEPEEAEITTVAPQPKQPREATVEEPRTPPTFPQRLKK
ncbi:hypothetical protein V6N12_030047 [Hibiscus sabdariffa]|uniref:Uncharacterized protein n=1 Tax=Hibiscus sabdariffa TaxID=183260 RepID=A0ABR2CJP2_9ROSI